jgi:hypothetical protein
VAFTEAEKDRILYHLSYPNWRSLAQSIQLGFPAASQPMFLVFNSFDRMTAEAENTIRRVLCECEEVERQISDARKRLRAKVVGDVEMNPAERRELYQELRSWTQRLADTLGVVQNPYSQRVYEGAGGTINARVRG